MHWFAWFDTRAAEAYAAEVVVEFCRIHAAAPGSDAKRARQAERYDRLVRDAARFAARERLNFYQRSKLLHAIEWGLAARSVDPEAASGLVRALVLARWRVG